MRHEHAIGDKTFYIRRFPAFRALEVLGDLQQRFGAPLLAAIEGRSDPASIPVMEVLVTGLRRISADTNGRLLAALAKDLVDPDLISVSMAGGEPRKLDQTAIDLLGLGPEDIVELCVEVVKVNYAPFLSRFASRFGEARSLLERQPGAYRPNSPVN